MSLAMLRGKVGVVTGCGQGIGKGIVKRLLEEGMSVGIAEIDEEAARATESQLKHLGPVFFAHTDVRDKESVKSCVASVVQEFGHLDAFVSNAGIAHADQGPIENLRIEDWNLMISTHLTGCFLCAKHASPYLRKVRGAIVNIASTRAFQSEPNTEAYAAAKGGIVALTHALAISLGPDVRVNCIAPGWVDVPELEKGSARVPTGVAAYRSFSASRGPGRKARGYCCTGGLPVIRSGRVYHRPDIHRRWRHDAQDDLCGLNQK